MPSRRAALAALATVGLAGCSAGASTTSTATDTPGRPDPAAVEAAVLDAVNREREAAGLSPYRRSATAAEIAARHARKMAGAQAYGHREPDGVPQRERYAACDGGEAIHRVWFDREYRVDGTTRQLSTAEAVADQTVRRWMGSRPHREKAVLGGWSGAGPGVATSDRGRVYVVLGLCR